MRINPFRAWRPLPELAAVTAAVPYDVVNRDEAAAMAGDNPHCFLRITRAELELPENSDPYAPEVYRRARDNFIDRCRRGTLIREAAASYYLYRLQTDGHDQTGIVACCHADDYRANIILKHEKTRPEKEDDRTRHIDTLNAHTGPVLLTYRDQPAVAGLMQSETARTPLYDFTAPDGVRHSVWRVADGAALRDAFAAVPRVYIADGHHRAASSVRVAAMRAAGRGVPDESAWFMTILFPAAGLRVLAYNRLVRDMHGLTAGQILDAAGRHFDIRADAGPAPAAPGDIRMLLDERWYALRRRGGGDDAVADLDVSILQNELLAPVLGINDPRKDPRIDFIGGSRGIAELENRARAVRGIAFSMYPVTVEQLMNVADRGLIMPPKSTWFDPKPRSGLLVHDLAG